MTKLCVIKKCDFVRDLGLIPWEFIHPRGERHRVSIWHAFSVYNLLVPCFLWLFEYSMFRRIVEELTLRCLGRHHEAGKLRGAVFPSMHMNSLGIQSPPKGNGIACSVHNNLVVPCCLRLFEYSMSRRIVEVLVLRC
ncbi:unnamed protein product [Ectocarpus sp. 13 AM-2016]